MRTLRKSQVKMSVLQELRLFWIGFILLSSTRNFFTSEKLWQPVAVSVFCVLTQRA